MKIMLGIPLDTAYVHVEAHPIPRAGQVLEPCEKLNNTTQELEAFRLL